MLLATGMGGLINNLAAMKTKGHSKDEKVEEPTWRYSYLDYAQ